MANYKNRVAGLLFDEGGISKDPRDNAARNPVPDGSGYHTNKGVTWSAFAMLAPKLGYAATPELFYKMPREVWLKIWKVGFWDAVKGDKINSQAVADMISDIAYNSGPGRAAQLTQRALNNLGYTPKLPESMTFGDLTLKGVNQMTNTKAKELALLKEIAKVRLAFLQSLDDWSWAKNGWTARVKRLVDEGAKLISSKTGLGLLFFSSISLIGWAYFKDK